jgi:hypothetical protein
MVSIKNSGYDPTADRVEEFSNLSLQQVDEAHRIDGIPGPALHVENELDAFGREQEPLWKAEGILQSRPALILLSGLKVQAETAEHLSRRHRRLVKRAQRRLERTIAALSPFVRRKEGQKAWFMVRIGLLLLGDVAGQAGAQIYYGEIPELALIQALAAGVAVVTAGLVGAEIKDLHMAAKRKIPRADLTKQQEPFAHLFDGTDEGKHIVRALVGTAVTVGVLISTGIFALRSTIDGPLSGLVYGALAAGIAAASLISSYVVTDEIADAISATESIDKTPVGQLMHGILAVFNEYRSREDGADIAYKMGQKAKNGGTLGRAPIGYLITIERFEGREVRSVSIDEERAPFVQLAFELYASGDHTLDDIASELTDRGLMTRGNVRRAPGPVSINKVAQMLRDRYYLGKVAFKGEEYDGRHRPHRPGAL